MAQSMRDNVKSGQNYSADYLRVTGLDQSRTFDTMFKLVRNRNKTPSSNGVISLISEGFATTDTSNVYRAQSINPDIKFVSAEYETSQTDTELLPALASNERYVITYGSVRTEAGSGETWLHTENSDEILKCYFIKNSSLYADALHLPMEQGKPVMVTSTQGTNKLFIILNYYIETVEVD